MAAVCMSFLAACGGGDGTPSTYSVGTRVYGLSGSGMVLQLNGGNDLAVFAGGNSTFATRLGSGAGYQVTVKTQPSNPTQTCTVANGSGTIGTANVTNVAITCVTANYTVGVTVSGLTGSGMVLQLNGGSDLSITANGNAVFPGSLNSGATYAVTIQTQPTLPAQSCAVANGFGTVGSANVDSVAITCITPGGGAAQEAATLVYFIYGSAVGGYCPNGVEQWASGLVGYSANSPATANPAVSLTPPNCPQDRYYGMAIDSSGYIYIASDPYFGSASMPAVLVFAPSANAMATPVRTLYVPGGVGAIALDTAANIYVSSGNSVLEFAAGASGNATPLRTLSVAAACSILAVDANGNIACVPYNQNGLNEVQIFASGQSGNAMPARTISGAASEIATIIDATFDPAGNIYVANATGSYSQTGNPIINILEFAAGTADTAAGNPINTLAPAAMSGDGNFGLQNIRFDAAGNLYAFGSVEGGFNSAVMRFAAGPGGFAAPTLETLIAPSSPGYMAEPIIAGFAVN
jgi:hypothetical protein